MPDADIADTAPAAWQAAVSVSESPHDVAHAQ
jgi:hypothetical protein